MAYCDECGNYDESHLEEGGFTPNMPKAKNNQEWKDYRKEFDPNHQPDLYYYWDAPLEEDYSWRDSFPLADCLCEICFDIANREKKIKWKEDN